MASISAIKRNEVERPVLDLSGDALRAGIQAMVTGAEEHGGIERYVDAVKLKSDMFRQAMDDIANLGLEAFMGLCTFMATVRRRVGPWLNEESFGDVRDGLAGLFDDEQPVDDRVESFCARFPNDKKHRWVRDLATEVMHNVEPERYPLMNRWVWDATANTGVLRDNGFFRDILQYVDILCAQVYAQYICEQGGSYLRADFSAPEDPMQHTRRLLGLDGVRPGSGRSRLKSIDGEAFVIDDTTLLN
jgi:hypothetical protein